MWLLIISGIVRVSDSLGGGGTYDLSEKTNNSSTGNWGPRGGGGR